MVTISDLRDPKLPETKGLFKFIIATVSVSFAEASSGASSTSLTTLLADHDNSEPQKVRKIFTELIYTDIHLFSPFEYPEQLIYNNSVYYRPGLSNLWQMAGRNYFFLKLAGKYTNDILLD